jgi:hypothetical protein
MPNRLAKRRSPASWNFARSGGPIYRPFSPNAKCLHRLPKTGPENYAGHRRKIVMLYYNNLSKAFSAVIPVSHYPGRPMSNPTAFITSFLARSALYRLVLVFLLLIAIWSAIFWSVSLP